MKNYRYSGISTVEGNEMQITLDTKLADIARHYGDPGKSTIHDNLDAIGDDLIDTDEVGQDWGWALDRVLRYHGEDATVRHLRDDLYEHAEVDR